MSDTALPVNEKQVFVRNLPFDVTSEDLTELFGEIGPLKNASVASANGVGKGFGFVKYALESDAHTAIEKLQGHTFRGRKLKLELGLKKERKTKGERADAEENAAESAPLSETTPAQKTEIQKEPKQPKVAKQATTKETAAEESHIKRSRQVLVFGVPVDLNKKQFRAITTKGFRKTEVDLLKEDHELSADLHIINPPGKVMLLTAFNRKDAAAHVKALDGATVHSLIVAYQNDFDKYQKQLEFLSKKQIKRGDKTLVLEHKTNQLEGLDLTKPRKEKLVVRTAAQVTPEEQRKRKCRLIVRNLSFLATEQNLLDRMSKFGPVVSVELPKKMVERTNDDKSGKGPKKVRREVPEGPVERSMGFGFVTFLCESDAQAAVKNSAGLKVCNREVAVDFCMSKETYEKFGKKQEEAGAEEGSVTQADGDAVQAGEGEGDLALEEGGDESEGDSDSDGEGSEEEDASDASEGEEGLEGEEMEVNEDQDDLEGSEADDHSYGDDEEEDGDSLEASESEGEGDDASEDGDGADDQEHEGEDAASTTHKKKEPTEDVHEGCTVFLRGLPFDAEPVDIKRALGKFGRIALAVIVKDKETEMSKGSAFVKFHQAEWASACVAEAAVHGGLTIKDRLCKVDLAVDRQSAKNIKESELAKRGKDKRNLYLANEGLVLPGADDAHNHDHGAAKGQAMSEADKEKRQRAQTEKRKKLQNPLFFVSGTRLSIRNLSKTITDKELRELCVTAAQAGIKKNLVKRADMENYRLAQGSDNLIQQLQKQGQYKPNMDLDTIPPVVGKHCLKACKIMLDMQRIRGGAPQSRGYGFAEFTHHAHALACLRELNNNAQYSSHRSAGGAVGAGEVVGGKLIVEFSLENIQKVKVLREREVRQQKRKESTPSEGSDRDAKRAEKSAAKKANAASAQTKAAPSATAAATATAQSADTKEAKKQKPVKSYVVSPDAAPAPVPEGVNPKHYLKQLERERQKKRKRDTGKGGAAGEGDAASKAGSSAAPAATQKKSQTQPESQPKQPQQQAKKAKLSASDSAPTTAAAPAVPSSNKRKASEDVSAASESQPKKAKSAPVLTQQKQQQYPPKQQQSQKQQGQENKKEQPSPAGKGKQGGKSGHASKAPATTPTSPQGGDAGKKPAVWGGHKRLRAAKKAGGGKK